MIGRIATTGKLAPGQNSAKMEQFTTRSALQNAWVKEILVVNILILFRRPRKLRRPYLEVILHQKESSRLVKASVILHFV